LGADALFNMGKTGECPRQSRGERKVLEAGVKWGESIELKGGSVIA